MHRTIACLAAVAGLLGAGCGRPQGAARNADGYGLVRDPERFRERGEIRQCVYDARDCEALGTAKEVIPAIEALVRLCARGEADWSVKSTGSGLLVVMANSGTHRLIREFLEQLRQHPRVWVTGAEWRGAFRKALAGADRVTVGKAEIAGADRVADFIAGFEFRDAYSGFDCECRLEPLIKFYKGGKPIGGLEYLPGAKTTELRWLDGPWDGNATLTGESAAWLSGVIGKAAPPGRPGRIR